ncbi:MAG: hypothetical protein HS116_14110 [Planctomycetes bacterium]|nr:hypothetical protein [Planctomycetota bacterium]
MSKIDLFSSAELPVGFGYPRQFEHIVELGLLDLEPWYVLHGKALRDAKAGLAQRYPERQLVPFARRQDNDDVACWQAGDSESVFVIHDFASVGWEQSASFASFYEWLRQAIEDLIEFDC